jgi:hypothetical protein
MNELQRILRFDTTVSETLYGDRRKNSSVAAERELMFAILADAVDCYWKYAGARDGRGIRLFQDARRWIFADDEAETFSFLNVCDALSFDPAYIRRGILQSGQSARGDQLAKTAPAQERPKKIKRNLKSTTRWKVSSRPLKS